MKLRQALRKRKKLLFGGLMLLMALSMSSITKAEGDRPDVQMIKGDIVFQVKTKAASSSDTIRYRTTGFIISMSEQTNMVTAGGISGPDAPPSPNGYISLKDSEKKEVKRTKEYVITEFRISEDRVKTEVKRAVGKDLDKLSEDTIIYLNASFETYQIINDNETKRKLDIRTWRDIVNAESWADPSIFKPYFNIAVKFNAGPQDNTLHFEMDGVSVPMYDLDSLNIGSSVTWRGKVNSKATVNETPGTLVGYYARGKLDDKGTPDRVRKMVGDTVGGRTLTVDDIINDSVKVLYGGMDIYMIYEPSDVDIVINAKDIDTGQMIKRDLYRGTVSPEDHFNKSVDSVIIVDGITYTKVVDFDYLYTITGGSQKKGYGKSDTADGPIKFQIPYNIKIPGLINVSAYYKKTVPGTIPVTIKAVDEFTGDNLKILKTDTISAGANYSYTISEAPLSVSGNSYNITGDWNWQYKKNTSSSPIITSEGSGTKVSFKAPSANDIKDGITVNVLYKMDDTESDEITLRVTMVSSSGGLIHELSTETVTRGQAISKQIMRNTLFNGTMYQYINKWDYIYMTSTGERTKSSSGDTASFTVPSTTSLGSVVNLRIYYDGQQFISVPEQQSPITLPLDTTSPQGIINGDKYLSSYFNSKNGISTTESQYVHIRTKDYLLGYSLVNRVGKIEFVVPVTMTYNLEYLTATPEEFGGPEVVTDVVTDTQLIMVERAYSYWEIEKLEYYLPSSANVYNYSLPDGGVHLTANSSYVDVPSLTTWHSSDIKSHIQLPIQSVEGIQLTYPDTITSDTSDRPMIDFIDLTSYAFDMTDELMVKNDALMFGGSVVMTNTPMEKITGRPNAGSMRHSSRQAHDKLLFTQGEVVDALKRNGSYHSNGNVTYNRHPMSVNAYDSTKLFNLKVNDVIIHTPVICKPIVHSDNDKYVQVLNPTEGAYHLVLDPDMTLNDFTVRISNHYPHSNRMGYFERDFSKSFIDPENISYIARKEGVLRNEMKLPFDVYLDMGDDKDPENDEFIKAGTWIVMGRETLRFYVPMWVEEGTYIAQFRTVAVNGEDRLDNTETTRNTNLNNYVATSTKTFQISGRMYGLTLYDVSDEGNWKEVFRVKNSTRFKYFDGKEDGTRFGGVYNKDHAYYYTVGINNQYGYQNGRHSQYTLPLMNGSHPQWRNIGATKTGYAVRFSIDTIGEMYASGSKIRIVPTFYHVDADGKNRQLVDIYYDEEFYGKSHRLVKVGEGIDLANLQQGSTGNPYSKIPEDEIRNTAKVMDTTYAKIANQFGPMYSYSDIRLSSQFRTFVGTNYASRIAGLPSFDKVKAQTRETETSLSKYMQRWYGTYKLPTNIHAVAAGYDVNDHLKKYGIDYLEDFWLKDGYIIVNFHIVSYDMDGNENLSYTNAYNYLNNGHCSMWVMEGGATEKTDNTGAKFRLYAGDFMFYYTSKKHSDDYMGRIY